MTIILKTIDDVESFRSRYDGKTIGFVPTMGNLHDGHLSLMKEASENADVVIASIFVNPTQFGQNEDLSTYPRTFDDDLEKLKKTGVAAVFFPDEATIYPYGKDATLSIHLPQSHTHILCGTDRPTHFQGVATVVAKLFQIIKPHVAVFGKKDYQQLAIIRRLTDELFMGITIIAGNIVREHDGLAMSSRNQYLDPSQRTRAARIIQTLKTCRMRVRTGEQIKRVLDEEKQQLNAAGFNVNYLECRDQDTLQDATTTNNAIILVAATIGRTRLIDNIVV